MVRRFMQPGHPVQQLRREMDRLFNGLLGPFGTAPEGHGFGTVGNQPPVNVWETEEGLHVELEVPGIKSEQADISVVEDQLSIHVERPDVQQDGMTFHRRERSTGSFTRIIRLPVPVDANRVEAQLQNGVLTIHLPRAESAKPRKIQVTASGDK